MKWYVYLALKQLFPSGKRLSFFSAMSIVGVSLGVAVLFIVQSVMTGFQHNIKQVIVDTQGDVRVESQYVISEPENLNRFLRTFSEIKASSSYVYGIAMLKHVDHSAFPLIKGIDVADELQVVALDNFIKSGNLSDFFSDSIILSSELAHQLGANIGSLIEFYSPNMIDKNAEDEVCLPKTLEVAAIYETGHQGADKNIAMIPLSVMQDLYDLKDGIHGISLRLGRGVSAEEFAFKLNAKLPAPLCATSWQEMNKDFLFALKTEKTMMFFVLTFILLIAAFSIMSSLMISVIRKTHEIGLIQALGGTANQCAGCFMVQGLILGAIGSFWGIVFGVLVLKFRNSIISIFVKLCGIEDFMLKFYSFANMPAKYGFCDIAAIVAFAMVLCCIAGILPAIGAAKIKPAEALRNE